MKIITICGSMRFKDEIIKIAKELELKGNCVIMPVLPSKDDKDDHTPEEFDMLAKMHNEKIKLADAVYIVNINGYIGDGVKSEIKFAKGLEKEVIYHVEPC